MSLVDTHCHLQDRAFDEDRAAVLQRSLEELEFLVVIGDELESSRRALALCDDRIFAAVGFHPYHAEHVDRDALQNLRSLASRPGVVAIGEIGLDYFNVYAEPHRQREAFRLQLDLAVALQLPVVIHCRDAHDDTASILESYASSLPGGIMHCFAGDADFARRCLALGFHISFAGNVTFPKASALREAANAVPLESLLVETDAPYLAPQPVRGKRCEPWHVRYTADALAALKGCEPAEFRRVTTGNARRLFKIDV